MLTIDSFLADPNPVEADKDTVITGLATGAMPVVSGGAISFTPQSNVEVANSVGFSIAGKTIAVNISSFSASDNTGLKYIVDTSQGGEGWILRWNNGVLEYFIYDASGSPKACRSSVIFVQGGNYTIECDVDPTSVYARSITVNGLQEFATIAWDGTETISNSPVVIGDPYDFPSLSCASNISLISVSGLFTYDFAGQNGNTTIIDSSGNGNNGTSKAKHEWLILEGATERYSGVSYDGNISQVHTADISEDQSSWTLEATNAGDFVVGDPLTLTVTPAMAQACPINSIDVTLDLKMMIREGWNDTISVFDEGSSADVYTSKVPYLSEQYNIWDRPESNSAPVTLSDAGFDPFGPHFDGSVSGYRYPVYKGKSNFHGDYHLWDVELIPDSSGGYSYTSPTWSPKSSTGFGIAGLADFPMPVCTPKAEYSISYGRIGNQTREYDAGENSEHRRFTMRWSDMCADELAAILVKVITVIRGNSFEVDFGESLPRMAPWLPREGEPLTGTYNLRLTSPRIIFSRREGGFWSLSIEVMKWG